MGQKLMIVTTVAMTIVAGAFGQEEAPAENAISTEETSPADDSGGQSLDQAANDPTAAVTSLQIELLHSPDFYEPSPDRRAFQRIRNIFKFTRRPVRQFTLGTIRRNVARGTELDDDSTGLQLRSAIPFKTGSLNHIFRITAPIPIDNPAGDGGLGDITVFDLLVFDESWGRWGVGAVALLPTATDDSLGADQWAVGPAVGFIVARPKAIFGLFNQNLFTVAGDDDRPEVDVSILQPIVNVSLGNGWSIGSSEMSVTYDWNEGDWINLPLGVKLSKLTKVGDTPMQVFGSAEHNFADDRFAPRWNLSLGVKFLF